jgi:hypothetical protein
MGLAEGRAALAPRTTAQLARFQGGMGPHLAACAELSERVAQLAFSHPLLFFGLAVGWGPLAKRCAAIELVVDGHPLADVCAAAGLPFLFRRLPAEACGAALPWVQWSTEAGSHLAPHMPKAADEAAAWLRAISLAHFWGDEDFAIWVASHPALCRPKPTLGPAALTSLALLAWFSRRPELAGAPPPAWRWSSTIGPGSAMRRLAAWLEQLQLISDVGIDGVGDSWLAPASWMVHQIVPLTTPVALVAEGRAMKNCVARYGGHLSRGRCRLFSLRKRGKRVATLEVAYSSDTGTLQIVQLKGPGNRKATTAARKIADRWLTEQAERPSWRPMAERGDGNFDTVISAYRTAFEVDGKSRSIPSLSQLALGLRELEHQLDVRSKQ